MIELTKNFAPDVEQSLTHLRATFAISAGTTK